MTAAFTDPEFCNEIPPFCRNHCAFLNSRTQTVQSLARRRVLQAPPTNITPTRGAHLPRHDFCIYFILLLNVYRTAASQIVFPVSGGAGSVSAQMYVYEDAGYANQHSGIPILKSKDMLYAEIALEHRIDALTLIARQCWATPEVTGMSSERFNIIEEPGCLNTAALNAKLTSNGIMWYTRFEFQVFTFLPENLAYIHCDIELCNPSDGRSCQPTCGASGRRKRSMNLKRLRSSVILRAKEPEPTIFHPVATTPDDQPRASDDIDMMPVVLVVVAALLMVIVVALVVYLCRTRKKKSLKAFKGDPLPKAHVSI